MATEIKYMAYDLETSRSQIMSYETCNRLRLMESHTGERGLGSVGIGFVPAKQAIPLAKGSTIHLGLQRLFEGASVDEACQDAMGYYDTTIKDRGFSGVLEANQAYTYAEQRCLAEAVIRVWAHTRLNVLLNDYEILAVEKEAPVVELAKGIGFRSRPDGVLRNKQTGFIEILSFKTASAWRDSQDEENENDIQGLSEMWTAQQVYGPVGSILMEYLILGSRKKQEAKSLDADGTEQEDFTVNHGPKLQDSFLVRPWRVGPNSYAFKGQVSVDNKNYKLGKFFDPAYNTKGKNREAIVAEHGKWEAQRVNIWEEMSPKEWFNLLASNKVFPYSENPFSGLVVSRKYERQDYELQEWKREAAAQETTVLEGLRRLELAQKGMGHHKTQEILDSFFPRRRKACFHLYGQKCSFFNSCWKGEQLGESLNFIPREPNHPLLVSEGEEE